MEYRIVESRRHKLGDYVEAENFEELLNLIGKTYRLNPRYFRAFCENRNGDLVYMVFNHNNKLAELIMT